MLASIIEPDDPSAAPARRWQPWVAAALAFVLGIAGTVAATRFVHEQAMRSGEVSFEGIAHEVSIRLDQRMDAYAQILRGGAGLVLTRATIDRDAWANYHRGLEIEEHFPGVQTFLWVPVVPAGGAAAFEARLRQLGHPDFRIWTRDQAPPVTTIAFIEPFVRANRRALGFDMASEPIRREAMERARDTGEATITHKVVLVIDDRPLPGFIMYVPVYAGNGTPADEAARRRDLTGYVASAFRVEDLLNATLGGPSPDFRVRVFDGTEDVPEALMYDTGKGAARPREATGRRFVRTLPFRIGGRQWSVQVTSTPAFERRVVRDHADKVAVAGALLSVLAAGIAALSVFLRQRTVALSQLMEALQAHQHDLERANAAITDARDRAIDAARAKSEFLANMSHEIRTPIHGFLGHTELALGNALDEETRHFLETAQSCGKALQAVVDDILDFSKLEAGRFPLDDMEFDLRALMLECVHTVALAAQAKRLALIWSADPSLPARFRGDPKRLRQVILNLLSNAVKFTAAGEVELTADPVPDSPGNAPAVRFAVRDSGIGMSPETRDGLFQAFYQGDTSITRRFGGTGLGLAISARIVALMGGKMQVESAAGVGSTFSFDARLAADAAPAVVRPIVKSALLCDPNPRRREALRRALAATGIAVHWDAGPERLAAVARGDDALLVDATALTDPSVRALQPAGPVVVLTAEQMAASTPALPSGWQGVACPHPADPERISALLTSTSTGRFAAFRTEPNRPRATRALRLLVAEDNPVNRRLIERMLVRLGHDTTLVEDGQQAVTAAAGAGNRWDAVLMDVQMPVMDGLEAARRIRAAEAATGAARLPIIALTADALPGDRERCLDAGMDGHLAKPISIRTLQDALDRLAADLPPDSPRPPQDSPAASTRADATT
jgi:signal transduction histidine kinase/ActR/RegA family two-component response regulator